MGVRKSLLVFIVLCLGFQCEGQVMGISKDTSSVEVVVDRQAEFPGGLSELSKFIGDSLIYPPYAIEMGISGTAYVKFIVDKDGKVIDPKIIKSKYVSFVIDTSIVVKKDEKTPLKEVTAICAACDKETLRVVNLMPRWKPAIKNEQNVKSSFVLPIRFKLQE